MKNEGKILQAYDIKNNLACNWEWKLQSLFMQKGFTLVELSIVLVIIGLLIGGILVAQSMIETAKVQGLIKELEQYNIAATNFRTNYHFEPGDDQFFVPPGDKNGYLDGSGCTTTYYNAEYYQSFAHLSQSGMVKNNFIPFEPVLCGGTSDNYFMNNTDISVPLFSTSKGVMAYYNVVATTNGFVLKAKGSYLLLEHDSTSQFDLQAFVSPMEAAILDNKMDNGKIANGSMVTLLQYSVAGATTCDIKTLSKAMLDGTACVMRWYPRTD